MHERGFTVKLKVAPKAKKTQEEKSRLGRRSKTKGSNYERTVAHRFKEHYGVDLVRTPQSGGFAKKLERADDFRGDIVPADKSIDFKLHVECKNTKTWSLPAWLKQAESDCPQGKSPVVIFHQHGTSNDYVCISFSDFLELVPVDSIILMKQE